MFEYGFGENSFSWEQLVHFFFFFWSQCETYLPTSFYYIINIYQISFHLKGKPHNSRNKEAYCGSFREKKIKFFSVMRILNFPNIIVLIGRGDVYLYIIFIFKIKYKVLYKFDCKIKLLLLFF
jgi:hypothetical protein